MRLLILNHILVFFEGMFGLTSNINVKLWGSIVIKRSLEGGWKWWAVKLVFWPSSYLGLPLGSNLKSLSF